MCFVYSVTESGELSFLPLDKLKICGYIFDTPDLLEGFHLILICSTMEWAPKRCDTCRNACEGICQGATCNSDSGCRWSLIVVSMQDEDLLKVVHKELWYLEILIHRIREHHIQEVLYIG
jgi:hypothetical protein